MANNIAKFGQFSDGGYRFRVVAAGYDADPAPSDPTKIIYDSDWPEVLATANGFFGSFTADPSGSNVAVSFPETIPFANLTTQVYSDASEYFGTYTSGAPTSLALATTIGGALWQGYDTLSGAATFSTTGASFTAPNAYTRFAWSVLLNDFSQTAANDTTSRAGTTWMKLSNSGPVVAKRGKDVRTATSVFDYIIPPASFGGAVSQPVLAGTVSSLPWIGDFTYTVDQGVGVTPRYVTFNLSDYLVTIPHSLGYIPLTMSNTYHDFRTATIPIAKVAIDENNVYIFVNGGPRQASGTSLTVDEISYFVLRPRWI